VEKIAGGQVPTEADIRRYAKIILADPSDRCCLLSIQ
jgi:hypothetical protein